MLGYQGDVQTDRASPGSLSSGVLKSCWMGGRQSLSRRSFQVAVIPFALGCVILTSRSPGRLHVDNGVYEGIEHNRETKGGVESIGCNWVQASKSRSHC